MAFLVHQLRLFFIALQFFTRVPIPGWVGFDPSWLHQSTRYFPLVGLGVALVAAGVYFAAAQLWPAPVAAVLSTAAGIYLTGAFHEDGFADMCDGFGGGMTRERVFEIMKDSRIGTYGTVGAGLLIALKCTLLAMLDPANASAVERAIAALAASGRSVMVSTHGPVLAARCDRVLSVGPTGWSLGPPDEALGRARVMALYGVDPQASTWRFSD